MAKSVRALVSELRDEGRAVLLSTHNLDEVDRIANRVAILRQRLLAVDTPAALRSRLFGKRVRVTLNGDPGPFIPAMREHGHPDVIADEDSLSIATSDMRTDAPDVVRLLVERGAGIVSVLPEEHSLEDVYLRLMKNGRPS
jgi:ABC-2 type transport system ATP-binding protein